MYYSSDDGQESNVTPKAASGNAEELYSSAFKGLKKAPKPEDFDGQVCRLSILFVEKNFTTLF